MSDELKPCPFCKNARNIKLVEYRPNCSGAVVCGQCGARGPKAKNDHRRGWKEKAIEGWNARAESTCRWVPFDEGHSIAGPGWRCSECGLELGPENAFVVEQCYCCPECQSRVVDE